MVDLAQSFPFVVVRWGFVSLDIESKRYLKEDTEDESRVGCGSSFHSRITEGKKELKSCVFACTVCKSLIFLRLYLDVFPIVEGTKECK